MADDGSVVLAGSTTGDWVGVNNGDHDLAALKLDANGTLLWKWQVRKVRCHGKETHFWPDMFGTFQGMK